MSDLRATHDEYGYTVYLNGIIKGRYRTDGELLAHHAMLLEKEHELQDYVQKLLDKIEELSR
jgi:hypothetical protein